MLAVYASPLLLCVCLTSAYATVTHAAALTPVPTHSAQRASSVWEQYSADLQQWMVQLYLANPHQLRKSTRVSAHEMADWVFNGPFFWKFDAIRDLQTHEALALSVSTEFEGDRILAFTTGTYTLLAQYHQAHQPPTQSLLEAAQAIQITLNTLRQIASKPEHKVFITNADYDTFTTLLQRIAANVTAE